MGNNKTTRMVAVLFLMTLNHHSSLTQSSSFYGDMQILCVGQFHKDEVNAKSGEVWLGLFPTQSGYELRRSTISVQPAHDIYVDQDTSIKTGWNVTVNSTEQPIVLIRNAKNLKEGPMKTSFFGLSLFIPGKPMTFRLAVGEEFYGIYADSRDEKVQGGTLYSDYVLKLFVGKTTQVIAEFDRLSDDGMPGIVWAGDLDRDGRLDLLLDLTNHYNVGQYTLFLSSAAKDGELVKKVADFRTGGC